MKSPESLSPASESEVSEPEVGHNKKMVVVSELQFLKKTQQQQQHQKHRNKLTENKSI